MGLGGLSGAAVSSLTDGRGSSHSGYFLRRPVTRPT